MAIAIVTGSQPESRPPSLPLRRIRAGEKLSMFLTCREPLQVWTHFVGGRTLPHLTEGCPGCERNRPKRYEGYFSGVLIPEEKHVIVGVPAGACCSILDAQGDSGSLRGRGVVFERRGKRPNGQVVGELRKSSVHDGGLPKEPNLYDHLCRVWGLLDPELGQGVLPIEVQIRGLLEGRELPGQGHLFGDSDVG